MSTPFRILIVEDNPLTVMNLEAGLSGQKFEICGIASDYREAVKMIKLERPDLLLIDVALGEGQADGIAVAREMQRLRPVPVIYLTGMIEEDVFEEARETNPVAFLYKPFRVEEVSRQITLALNNYYGSKEANVSGIEEQLYIPDGNDRVRVDADEIAYIEAEGAYTRLFLAKKGPAGFVKSEKLVAVNLANVKMYLPPYFYEIPRSLCINLHYLDRIGTRRIQLGPYEVEIPGGKGKKLQESVKLVRAGKNRTKKSQ